MLFRSRGLWSAVSGEDTNADNDQRALALLGLYVKEHHLPLMERCKTAKEAWQQLEAMYQAKSNARKLQLRKELVQLKMGPGEPLTKYVGRARDIQDQLRAAGHDVADQEVVWAVLAGLPAVYDTVVTVLETTTDKDMSLEDILPKLLQVEQRERQMERPDERALMAKPSSGFGGGGKPGGGGQQGGADNRTCFYCKKKGHIKADCRKKKWDDARRSGGGKQQALQQKAHQQLSAIALTTQHCTEAVGFSSSISSTGSTQRWVLDTGASRHMTPHEGILVNVRPMTEDITVSFGNGGKFKPIAVGDVILRTGKTTLRLTDVLHVPVATENLFSVRHATNSGISFSFNSSGCRISKGGHTLVTAPCQGDNIYYLTGECKESSIAALLGQTTKESPELWHRRFGHLGYDNLAKLLTKDMVTGISISAIHARTERRS